MWQIKQELSAEIGGRLNEELKTELYRVGSVIVFRLLKYRWHTRHFICMQQWRHNMYKPTSLLQPGSQSAHVNGTMENETQAKAPAKSVSGTPALKLQQSGTLGVHLDEYPQSTRRIQDELGSTSLLAGGQERIAEDMHSDDAPAAAKASAEAAASVKKIKKKVKKKVELVLNMDFASIVEGSPERASFEASFVADVAKAAGIDLAGGRGWPSA
jgi:hypothetical protein